MVRCPDCGEENPGKFRLCGYCGAQLVRPVASQEVRKTVTIVFCDLKGSTSLGERLDSESLREVLSVYFATMREVLERHGGTVEKYIGDAIMAVFGLPKLHEDDALRAVRAAFEMGTALRQLNVRLRASWGVTLANRTGVNTGEVVAGDAATGQRLATGDTVNVAARLEQAAPEDEVLIGETTFRLTRGAIRAEPVEPLELKGKSGRVPAYRLLGVGTGEAITRRVDLPLVGRDEAFGHLLVAFGRTLAAPRCEIVTVLGQAGLGKSRLIEEFVRHVGDRAQILRGRCLSYGEGITFWPVAEALRQAAGIAAGDSQEQARARLVSLVGQGREDVAQRIGSLMGVSPEGFGKDELLWSVRAVLEIMARRRPLVVIFDDIHWAEHIFLDLIEQIGDSSPGVPLLILCAARHELLEERPGFLDGASGVGRIELSDLAPSDTAQVLANLLGGVRLPASLGDRILSVASGNPLFVEQMVSMLADSGVISDRGGRWAFSGGGGDVEVPPSVASLLSARLDGLQPLERGIVERASVVGVDFQPAAVVALAQDAESKIDLAPPLSALCAKRLIRARDGAGEDGYQFTNLLLRDTAYDRLLKRARARMHERFADWLLEVSGGRVAEREEIIGYHLEQSFRYRAELGPVDEQARSLGDRAARHLGTAGQRAFDRGDMHAAASLLQRAAGLLPTGHPGRPRLLLVAGDALADLGELAESQAVLGDAGQAAALIGDDAAARAAELAGLHLRYTTDAASTQAGIVARVQELIGVLEAAGDNQGLARAWRLMTFVHWTANQCGMAADAAGRAIGHARQAGDELTARRFSGSLVVSLRQGPTPASEAIAHCQEMLPRLAADRKAVAVVELTLAMLEAMRANFDLAREHYRRSRAQLEEFGYRLFAALTSIVSGPVEMLAGDQEAAERELSMDYETLERMGERNYISTTAGTLAEVLYRQGRYEEAAEFAADCQLLASPDDVTSQFLWRCAQAKLLARDGRHEEAGGLMAQALELIGTTDCVDMQGDGFMDLAEVCRLGGRTAEALGALAQASERFTAKGNVVSARRAAGLTAELRVFGEGDGPPQGGRPAAPA